MGDDRAAAPTPSRARVALWWAALAVAGFVVMGVEVAAARLFAPTFGSTVAVWGSLLGGVMAAMAIGYAAGGWLADRVPDDRPVFVPLAIAGAWQAATPWMTPSLLPSLAADASGPLVATLILLFAPMALLASVPPVVVRLLAHPGGVGTVAGRVSAVSTVAGVAGALVTALVLLPSWGTRTTWLALCAAPLALAAVGLWARSRWSPLALLLAAAPFTAPRPAPVEGEVWAAESPYQLVRVVRRGDATGLLLDQATSLHSMVREGPWTGRYYDDFALGPLLVDAPKTALLLGLGAGGALAPMWEAAPDLRVDGVEIDPVVVEAGERWFGLDRSDPRLAVHVADARPWLARQDRTWDVVGIDLYQGGPYVPFQLATAEFYALVRAHTSDGGVVVLNVVDPSATRDLLASIAATLRTSFATLLVVSRPSGNHTVLAFPEYRDPESVSARLRATVAPSAVRDLAHRAQAVLGPLETSQGGIVFTDDHAPIEAVTRKALAGVAR